MASQHTFVGTDIEKSYFPSEVPKNTTYHVQDLTKPWPAEWSNSFDLLFRGLELVSGAQRLHRYDDDGGASPPT